MLTKIIGAITSNKKLSIVTLIVLVLMLTAINSDDRPTYSIGYIGVKDPGSVYNRLNQHLIESALEKINTTSKTFKLKLELPDQDDSHAPHEAGMSGHIADLYQDYAENDDTLLIIDNSWGRHLAAASDTIKKLQIPVISLNADKSGVDYGGNVLFLGSDDDTPRLMLQFAQKVLKTDSIVFISEKNYSLTKVFQDLSNDQGIVIEEKNTCYIDDDLNCHADFNVSNGEERLSDFIEHILAKYKNTETRLPLILINAHREIGEDVIEEIHNAGKKIGSGAIDVLASASVVGASDVPNMDNVRLYIHTDPMDAISNKLYKTLEQFYLQDENNEKTANDPLFANRVDIAANIVKLVSDSEKLASQFSGIFSGGNMPLKSSGVNGYKQAVLTLFESVSQSEKLLLDERIEYFHSDRRLIRRNNFDMVYAGNRLSYPWQLNVDGDEIPNNIIRVSDVKVLDINQADKSFSAEFSVWVHSPCDLYKSDSDERCKGVLPGSQNRQGDARNQFWSAGDRSGDVFGVLSEQFRFKHLKSMTAFPVSAKTESLGAENRYTYVFKIVAEFFTNFDYHDFPFDSQELLISVRMMKPPTQIRASIDSYAQDIEREKFLKTKNFDGWLPTDYYHTVDSEVSWVPSYGEGKIGVTNEVFNSVSLRMPIDRLLLKPILLIILPVIMIGLAAISILYLSELTFTGAGEVAIVIFLSLITYSLSLTELIPAIEQPTKAHVLFYLTFALVVILFMYIVYLNSELTDRWKLKKDFDRVKVAISTTIAYVLVTAAATAWY